MKKNKHQHMAWWVARLVIITAVIILYGWTVFEPFSGDALMHMMDDTQIHSIRDAIRVFYSTSNPDYHEQYRLLGFHRPVFNEIYISSVKAIFGVSSFWLRITSVIIFIGTAMMFISLVKRLGFSPLTSIVATSWLMFSPALFFGLYEYGLSFSVLLVFFATSSLLFIKNYIDTLGSKYQYFWASAAALSIFFTVFTKESAVVWPIVCLLIATNFIISNDSQIHQKTFFPVKAQLLALLKIKWFALLLLSFIVLYFYTRYLKLGSLTAIAGGIEQSPTLSDGLYKLVGYGLLALQIPNSIIPDYMTQELSTLSWQEISLRVCSLSIAVATIFITIYQKRYIGIILAICCVLSFLPIIKVTRNAPYYGDLMAIPVAILIGYGFNFINGKHYLFRITSIASILCLFISASFFAYRYVFIPNFWLTNAQGWTRSALEDLSSANGFTEAKYIVATSGMYVNGINWVLSHTQFGSSFIANLAAPKEKFLRNSSLLKDSAGTLFIDFAPNNTPRNLGNTPFPGFGKLYTAYFPKGYDLHDIEGTEESYDIRNMSVVRIECAIAPTATFEILFTSDFGNDVRRSVAPEANLKIIPEKFITEFVVPENTQNLIIQKHSCSNLRVTGYSTSK
ncbi:phospholipid carrier-dependent glycosyltransferase [Cellvibrio sp. PSBB023]|uniref:phospholipid carrier-dependent glycosyltransferase n=1 Tax=Cellvibrio sp. PSBB023 TaxID=1945512 RepID=UPI00098E960E|nr:phospholipid carrier-dependent glycosyltransferase [Cellvibrio sp. PSBB023]AQT61389.1 hypothetical protein B0D95_15695 [Cellvibrio sp. PSBB023]